LRALAEAGSPAAAVAANPSPVADLVARLVMDEPRSEPFHAVRLLLRDVAQRKLKELSFTTGTVPDPDVVLADSAFLKRCIGDLAPDQRDAGRSVVAAERLLAWLRHGSETGDGD
jgi:hypothetical protein